MNEFYSELLYTYHQDSSINILLYLIYSIFVHLFIYLLFFVSFVLFCFCLPPAHLFNHAHILLSFFFCWMHFKVNFLHDFEISSISASIFYPLIWTYDTDTSLKSVPLCARRLFFMGYRAGREVCLEPFH